MTIIDKWHRLFPNSYFQTFADNGERGRVVCVPLYNVSQEEASVLNEEGAGIYFSPNGFSSYNGRNEKNCDMINWWFVDIEGYAKEEQLRLLKEFPLQPTMVVETKNGHHAYWKISGISPYWYKIIDRLIEHFGSDLAISSYNEVLRIPDFWHQKDQNNKFKIKLLSENDKTYTEQQMLEVLGEKKCKIDFQITGSRYEDDLDQLKEIPIRTVLDKLGVRYERNVIFENGKKTSAFIHPKENYIHRFSGKPGSGSTIDAVMAWGRAKTPAEAIEWLRNEFGIARKKLKEATQSPITKELFTEGGSLVFQTMNRVENTDKASVIKYHIKELNDLLVGIFPTSLIVVGSDTGVGKSQFLGDLAYNACSKGKKVVYFDLENDDGDCVLRQVAKQLSKRINSPVSVNHIRMKGAIDEFGEYLTEAYNEVWNTFSHTLFVYKNAKVPTLDDFLQAIAAIREKKDCDLILIDHLHYFDMNDKETQSTQLGKLMREFRQLTKSGVPIVIASHLKQRQSNGKPTNFDLFGSSNIAKEAESVILFSRKDDQTIMAVTKNRSGGGMIREFTGTFNPVTREIEFDKIF